MQVDVTKTLVGNKPHQQIIPRPYQNYVFDCVKNWIKYKPESNGYIKAAGGAGKSVMIAMAAQFCHDVGKHVIVLARSEKLLTQNKAKFAPECQDKIGIYCAGIGEKDLSKPITIASIQSIQNAGVVFAEKNTIILIDEVQNLHPDDEGETQYWNFIRACGNPQIIGFTATDFRLKSGKLTFGEMIVEVPIKQLIDGGYIVPPNNKVAGDIALDKVPIVRGEYSGKELDEIYTEPELLETTITTLWKYTRNLHSVVIFCQSRNHAKILQQAMADNEMHAVYVDGDTPKNELSKTLDDFQNLKFQYLINVALLIEGWDCPVIDCVVVLMSTLSKGKFEQILYRGTRLCPELDKKSFLALDMGGNFIRHGSLGSPYREPAKRETAAAKGRICPECETWHEKANIKECGDCGYQFPEMEAPKVTHNRTIDTETSTVYQVPLTTYTVKDVGYYKHVKKGTDKVSLRIEYYCDTHYGKISEWLSPHNESAWARENCRAFFLERGVKLAGDLREIEMDELVRLASYAKMPAQIVVDHSEKYPRIKKYVWEVKEPQKEESNEELLDDIIPF